MLRGSAVYTCVCKFCFPCIMLQVLNLRRSRDAIYWCDLCNCVMLNSDGCSHADDYMDGSNNVHLLHNR